MGISPEEIKPKKTFKEKSRYFFDNLMSRGTLSLIGFLAIISLALIIIFTTILWFVDLLPGKGFIELLWLNIFKTLGTGTLSGAEPGQLNFFLSFLIALASIFITSLLIGLLTAGIQQKIWSLRQGRSKVIESGHTIILGWSEIIFTVIRALNEAALNQKTCKIVIMAPRDKTEMEETIREKVKLSKKLKIICRKGNPIDLNDLKIVNLSTSRSIIIIEDSDSKVLKTILAINASRDNIRIKPFNIVTTLNENKNLDSGKIAGAGQAKFVLSKSFIARLIANICYQPGLSLVYNDLLTFKGDEIYISEVPGIWGRTFKEAAFMFEDSAVIGINSGSSVRLNPPPDTVIGPNDRIIAISADDNTVLSSGIRDYKVSEEAICISDIKHSMFEKILILGWNEKAPIIIDEIRNFISSDTAITVVCSKDLLLESKQAGINFLKYKEYFKDLKDSNISFIDGDINDHEVLLAQVRQGFDHVIVLAYPGIDIQETDSITLMSLIHLRDIAEKNNLKFSITSEMLDANNMELAKVAKVDDFIVGGKLVSLLLAQISENELLNPVFEELLSEYGSEIYLKNIEDYINLSGPVNFYTVLEAANRKNDLAIGYKIIAEENISSKNFGVYMNPDKSLVINFSAGDSVIVMSEKK
ncbi:MAG: potassium transporter TrkA [Actinobacteria bacterium]|nr:potassium transporter TrkA [Actinomycetota bacterium]